MKVRNGFVSNSSSSSFIIAIKSERPSEAQIKELFGVVPGSIAERLVQPYVDKFVNAGQYDVSELLNDHGYRTLEGMIVDYGGVEKLPKAVQYLQKGWNVYHFRATSDDWEDPIGAALHDHGLPGGNIVTEDLVITRDW